MMDYKISKHNYFTFSPLFIHILILEDISSEPIYQCLPRVITGLGDQYNSRLAVQQALIIAIRAQICYAIAARDEKSMH